MDGNQTLNSVASRTSETSREEYDNEEEIDNGSTREEEVPVGWRVESNIPEGWRPAPVPSHWGFRPARPVQGEGRLAPARHVVRRDEGLVAALSLPAITLYNMRSIWAKAGSLADDILFRHTDICFLTEIWESLESKKHKYKIEEMLEMKGIHYISTPRPGSRRGGGVAIAFPATKFQVTKLNVAIPKPLECMFALVKPVDKNVGKIQCFVAVCFYSPPKSKKNSELIDLITVEISRLCSQHSGCGVLICGDKNDLHIEKLLSGDPSLRQIVVHNTNKNKDKVLDVVMTDLHAGYQEPVLLPAVPVDQGRQGVPSDHAGVSVSPRTNLSTSRARPRRKTFEVQRMPASLVTEFGPVLMNEAWNCLLDGMSADEMVGKFQEAASRLVDTHFPKKNITVIEGEKPYFTEELKKLRRKRDRIYQKSGKS